MHGNYSIKSIAENKVEFIIESKEVEGGTKYTMFRSNDRSIWTRPGEELISAYDDGNGLHLDRSFGTAIDYSDFAEVLLFFSAIKAIDTNMIESYEIVQEKVLAKI